MARIREIASPAGPGRSGGIPAASASTGALAEPDPPQILVLTAFDTDDMVLRALQLSASGFLLKELKDTPPPKAIDAIRAVARGEPVPSAHTR